VQKSLTSANCISPFELDNAFGTWRSLQAPIDTAALPLGLVQPAIRQLALSHAVAQSTIDMDNVT
jgi:hypothetical protein